MGSRRQPRNHLKLELGMCILGGLLLLVLGGSGTRRSGDRPDGEGVRRDFNLSPAKASALYALLAPSDIKVTVRKRPRGVTVHGTPREVAALRDLVDLVNRVEGHGWSAARLKARIDELRPSWTCTDFYELPPDKAKCLWNLLSIDGVPLAISGGPSRLRIDATCADHNILRTVVEILKGRPLESLAPDAMPAN